MSLIKRDYDTVRGLEKKGFRAFWISGVLLVLGILFSVTAILLPVGIPLVVAGIAGFVVSMIWMSAHSKEPTRRIICPYCTSTNEVFQSRKQFNCDICHRPVAISPDGELIALQDDDYDEDD